MSQLMEASQVLSRPNGMQLIGMALEIACSAARTDVELDCAEYADGFGTWWNTQQTAYMGDSENEQECRELLNRSVAFLDAYGRLQRHPTLPHCVRFPEV
jgi:hypothetical protein